MDECPKHQEPIHQATAQFYKGQHPELLNVRTRLTNRVQKTNSIKELCRVMEMRGNRCRKLGVQDSEDSEIEEVVLRVQGIVCNRELPPIRKPFKVFVLLTFQWMTYSKLCRQPNRRPYLQQSLMLTGLSLPKFNDAVMSLSAIENIFRQQAVDGNMEVWAPSAFQGHLSIDIGNRYFTPRQHALHERHISFSTAIDPDNILSEAMGEEFVHTEDNEVEYYEARKEAGRTKWVLIDYWCNRTKLKVSDVDILISTPMQFILVILSKPRYRLRVYN